MDRVNVAAVATKNDVHSSLFTERATKRTQHANMGYANSPQTAPVFRVSAEHDSKGFDLQLFPY